MSLTDAVSRALDHNAQIRIAALETGQAHDRVDEERSAYLPHLAVTSDAGYSNRWNDTLRTVDRSGHEQRFGLTSLGSQQGWLNVEVEQLLFDWRQWLEVGRAERDARAAALAEEVRREEVALEVVHHYADALRLEAHLAVDERQRALLASLERRARAFAKEGRIAESDLAELVLSRETAEAGATVHRSDLDAERERLCGSVGIDAEPGASPAIQLDEASLPVPTRDVPGRDAVMRAPDIELLAAHEETERQALAAERATALPTAAVRGGYANYGPKRFDNYPDEARIGVEVRVPIFDGFRRSNAVAREEKGVEIHRLRWTDAVDARQREVVALGSRLSVAAERQALARRRTDNASRAIDLATLRLDAGRATAAEVTGFVDGWQRAAHEAVDVRFDAVLLWASVQRLDGTLVRALGADTGERGRTK